MITVTVTSKAVWDFLCGHPGVYSASFDPDHRHGDNVVPQGTVTFCTGRSAKAALMAAREDFGSALV